MLVMMAENDTGWEFRGEFLGGGREGDYFLRVTFWLGVVVGHILDGDASHGGVLEFAHGGVRKACTIDGCKDGEWSVGWGKLKLLL